MVREAPLPAYRGAPGPSTPEARRQRAGERRGYQRLERVQGDERRNPQLHSAGEIAGEDGQLRHAADIQDENARGGCGSASRERRGRAPDGSPSQDTGYDG